MSEAREPELWCVDLDAAAPALHAIEARTPRLSEAEAHRAAALSDPATRNEWLAAHIALRLLIERACGPQWRGIAFAHEERGKPVLAGAPILFSLSHAPGLALIGIAEQGVIGVDIERVRTVRIDAARRARIRAAGAIMAPAPLPSADDAGFLQAWVRLEALAKAEGCGIGRMLTRLGILGAGARAQADAGAMRARAAALRAESPAKAVHDLQLGDAVYAAVACSGAPAPPSVSWLPTAVEALEKPIN